MAAKEKNFISAVIYLSGEEDGVNPFLSTLCPLLEARFASYELIFVEDASRDASEERVKEFLAQMETPPSVTMIHMSLKQGKEVAMNAGIDMAIGDFVYEFDSVYMPYPVEMMEKAYETCLAGNDIVTVSPGKNRNMVSGLFYSVFNANSKSKYKLQTDSFRLLSRRAINRVRSISDTMPYRKAAYAASGLKIATLTFSSKLAKGKKGEDMRLSKAVDSLALYTNVGYRVAFGISMLMLLLMLAALVYTVVVFLGGVKPVPGWTTTMLLLTGGFFGMFLLLTIVLKYMSLLVGLVFKKQQYLVESIEKIT